jgi:hypothetical protein
MAVAGTSKDEILEKWGEPYDIIYLGEDEMGVPGEVWLYKAWFPGAPLDYRHFSRPKKIYFRGGFVTRMEDDNEGD